MNPKYKRLIILILILSILGLATKLVLMALNENIIYFYTPNELKKKYGNVKNIDNKMEEMIAPEIEKINEILKQHDKELLSFKEEIEIEVNLSEDDRIKLDKKIITYKAEATYFKKMYEKVLKENTRVDLIIDTIRDYAPAFKNQPKIKYTKPKGKTRGASG